MIRSLAITLGAVGLSLAAAPAAEAKVLDLDYTVSPIGGGAYQYDFWLKLTNADGTWTPGNQFDWIIFGDRSGFGQPSGLCPTSCSSAQFTNFSSPDPNATLNFSGGGHEGPTISYGANSVLLPGWQPAGVGSVLRWSGRSSIMLGKGQLYFTTLATNGPRADFQLANQIASAVPEPATWVMMILGVGMVGGALRRRRQQKPKVTFAF